MFVRLLPPRSAVGLATTSQGSGYFLLQLDQPGNYYRNTVPKVVPDLVIFTPRLRIRSIFGRIPLVRISKTGSGSHLLLPRINSNIQIFSHHSDFVRNFC